MVGSKKTIYIYLTIPPSNCDYYFQIHYLWITNTPNVLVTEFIIT